MTFFVSLQPESQWESGRKLQVPSGLQEVGRKLSGCCQGWEDISDHVSYIHCQLQLTFTIFFLPLLMNHAQPGSLWCCRYPSLAPRPQLPQPGPATHSLGWSSYSCPGTLHSTAFICPSSTFFFLLLLRHTWPVNKVYLVVINAGGLQNAWILIRWSQRRSSSSNFKNQASVPFVHCSQNFKQQLNEWSVNKDLSLWGF